MRDHCSARDQIGTGPVRAALAGPAWALHSIVGWELFESDIILNFSFENCFSQMSNNKKQLRKRAVSKKYK